MKKPGEMPCRGPEESPASAAAAAQERLLVMSELLSCKRCGSWGFRALKGGRLTAGPAQAKPVVKQ
ncbi:hypothetical protein EK904_008982 [Melospiza melodia maxima]|nr:hypothetical protein EK904_008982 [Melospiza melodia maxima]